MIGNRFPVDPLGDLPVSGLFDSLLRLALNPGVANIPAGPDARSADSGPGFDYFIFVAWF
jgi:hypothetical protein